MKTHDNENNDTKQTGVTADEEHPLSRLIREERYKAVEQYLKQNPALATQKMVARVFKRKTECYPLHYLCTKRSVPPCTLETMLQLAPTATCSADDIHGYLPLHLACWYGLPEPCIRMLVALDKQKTSLLTADKQGNLALHHAAALAEPCVVELLLQQQPSAARKLNHRNQSALHCACGAA